MPKIKTYFYFSNILKNKKHTQYAFYIIFYNYLLNLGKEKAATTALIPTRE